MQLMDIPIHQKIFALITSVVIFVFIIEMLRRRKLKEEYSWLWILTGIGMIILVFWYKLLVIITNLIGAVTPTTTLFLFSNLFLLVLSIHYSIIISKLTHQIKDVSQEIALLKIEMKEK